jgi:hypothetical protein
MLMSRQQHEHAEFKRDAPSCLPCWRDASMPPHFNLPHALTTPPRQTEQPPHSRLNPGSQSRGTRRHPRPHCSQSSGTQKSPPRPGHPAGKGEKVSVARLVDQASGLSELRLALSVLFDHVASSVFALLTEQWHSKIFAPTGAVGMLTSASRIRHRR